MSAPPRRAPAGSARSLTIGLHVVFVVLVVLAVARAGSTAAAVAGVGLAGWYVAGVGLRRRRSRGLAAAWLVVLTAAWAAASLVVASDFVWVAFPLFFLHLFLLPIAAGVGGVVAVTVVAITALAADGGLQIAEVVGPAVGAAVATLSALSYRALATEHQRTRRLLAELEATEGQLAEAQRARGALDERHHLAREMHDTIAQGLSSIVLLARAEELAPTGDHARMTQVRELAQANLDEARRIVSALSPPELDGSPLPDALERATHAAADASGIDIGFRLEGPPGRMPVDHEIALLRIAQGALANATSHAKPGYVRVTLSYLDDCTTLDVVDDGVGFDPTDVPERSDGSGFGLRVMRERLDEVGGTVTVESEHGEGTAVMAAIPKAGA